jgi:6-phosphogluconolactonase
MADPRIVTAMNPNEEAGRLVAEALIDADRRTGSARLAIPGGSALAALGPARARLPPEVWSRVRLTFVDERCVPLDSPDSNHGDAIRANVLGSPASVLPLCLEGEGLPHAFRRVAMALSKDFGGALDVVLLGLGEDGHVASLFPGHAASGTSGPVATMLDSPKPPARRITLTVPFLATASAIVLLATGEPKRAALERLARRDPSLPASRLGRLTIVTDLSLATGLSLGASP